jgi:hypothetical protein
MNNALINKEYEVASDENLPALREQVTRLTEVIEALQNIQGSSYWLVLKQHVFDVDLRKAKNRLVSEKDTTEIFRLQGEITWGNKFNLEKLLQSKRNELSAVRKKLTQPL